MIALSRMKVLLTVFCCSFFFLATKIGVVEREPVQRPYFVVTVTVMDL